MLVQVIFRYRIDTLGHGVGTAIVLVVAALNFPELSPHNFLFWFSIIFYSFHGFGNDLADKGMIKNTIGRYFQLNFHYISAPLILYLINPAYWIIFPVSIFRVIGYEGTRYFFKNKKL